MKLDILAFGAHPDDVELGCGGTLAKAVADGKKVGIIDLTEGEMATRGTPDIRSKESIAASKILGVSFRYNLNLPFFFAFAFDLAKRSSLASSNSKLLAAAFSTARRAASICFSFVADSILKDARCLPTILKICGL